MMTPSEPKPEKMSEWLLRETLKNAACDCPESARRLEAHIAALEAELAGQPDDEYELVHRSVRQNLTITSDELDTAVKRIATLQQEKAELLAALRRVYGLRSLGGHQSVDKEIAKLLSRFSLDVPSVARHEKTIAARHAEITKLKKGQPT